MGTSKSGTHSIANIFSRCYNARHEPEHNFLIDKILAAANGKIDQKAMARYLMNRDKRLWLELESSLLTNFLVDILVTEFKPAKFILTIRDCYSWLDSVINSELNRPLTYSWQKWLDFAFKANQLKHSQAEKILAEHGLYSLDGYLSYWASCNRKVLTTVPEDRLLIVKTHEITQSIDKIAAFLEIPRESLEVGQSHSYRGLKKHGFLSKIDRDFLEEKVNTHCREIMAKYFP